MEFYKLTRTVSHYNDEAEDIVEDFMSEYSDNKTLVVVNEVDEAHITGFIQEYIKGENDQEVKNFCISAESLIGECFSLHNLNGELVFCSEML